MTQEAPVVTAEQLTAIRESLFKATREKYIEFINAIRNLPIHPSAFTQAFVEFDTGILWAKEAIMYGAFVQPELAPTPTDPVAEIETAVVLDSEAA